jgi:signal transduction histidine kinase
MPPGSGTVYAGAVGSQAVVVMRAALGALWAPRSWRATLHALTGMSISVLTLLGVALWAAAAWSLTGATAQSGSVDVAIWAVGTVIGAVLLVWWLGALGAVQRARFHALLGVEIPAPPQVPGWRPLRPVRAWRTAASRRQLAYHLLSLLIGPLGGVAVAFCWSALLVAASYPGRPPAGRPVAVMLGAGLLLAAPWVARWVARTDKNAARTLLGPSREQQLAHRVETLARSRAEVVAATDAERRRIERDLHDGAQQRLVSLAMNLGMARAALTDMPPDARNAIVEAHEEAIEALAELRDYVRGLHPAVLVSRGLDAALSGIVARAAVPVQLSVDLPDRCPPSVEAIAYFMVAEALTNIARHAQATRASVTAVRVGAVLRVTVIDDGRGGAALGGDGTGLRGLAQRAAAVDGTMSVDSPVGGPTRISVELPCG